MLCASVLPLKAQAQGDIEAVLRKVNVAQMAINYLYVDSVDNGKVAEDAIRGMLQALDPHSTYTNVEETKKFTEPLAGNFDGIGVQFNIVTDTVVVIKPVRGGPSERAGVRMGDRIVGVNGHNIAGQKLSRDSIMKLLRGPRGTIAELVVVRPSVGNKLHHFRVKRDKIPLVAIEAAYMLTPTVGLIRFDSFGANTHQAFVEAMLRLRKQGMTDLIIDLQSNGGGYLGAAVSIASEFLSSGDLVVYTKGRTQPLQEFRATSGGRMPQGRVVVLIDEFSASAAEILAGALQDHDRATIIGRRSFGKGLVQRPIDLPDGSMIRLTTAHYYTPSGRDIQKPYVKGKKDDYERDLLNRFEHGEFMHQDSILLVDSLKVFTLKKHRPVYGGGGIMPDIFVPVDTTANPLYYRKLSRLPSFHELLLTYTDRESKRLRKRYPTIAEFRRHFAVPQHLTDTLQARAAADSIVARDEAEATQSLARLRHLLKALIARNLWDSSEFYEVIYEDDPIVQRALAVLREE